MTRIGGWLFRHRTIIPLPLALLTLLWPSPDISGSIPVVIGGLGLVAIGEGLRLWGVHHIGVISRTRTDRLGPLVASGPFAFVRNPLYIGNITLWAGLALSARLPWLAPIFVLVLAVEYDAIVRWEERLLVERLGDTYREYAARVPRWMPNPFNRKDRGARRDSVLSPDLAVPAAGVFSWRETLFSERGTLIAIALGYVLLWLKTQL
jgi:protein-S-isoprenylcysteine O-methyltransferase Ste14